MFRLLENLTTAFDTSGSCSNDAESAINTDYIAATYTIISVQKGMIIITLYTYTISEQLWKRVRNS